MVQTVGCIGGYAQGGGHSPASRNYGLGADQILEAQVILANGAIPRFSLPFGEVVVVPMVSPSPPRLKPILQARS
jgi:FAD/FMN-containing dehydrogenase